MRSKMISVRAIEMREAVLLGVLTTIQEDSSDNHLGCNYGQIRLAQNKMKPAAYPRSTFTKTHYIILHDLQHNGGIRTHLE